MGGAVVVDPGRDRSGILSRFSVLIMAFLGQVLLGGARLLSELNFPEPRLPVIGRCPSPTTWT